MNEKGKIMLVSSLKEKELHPFLVKWVADKWGLACKTIDQSKSKNRNKGENEWVHPDIVGVQFDSNPSTRTSFSTAVEALYQKVNKEVEFYSFELKCSVTLGTLKHYYFQAVSNSSWANMGYLVTAELDIFDPILMEELGRLVNAFGIGVILLRPDCLSQSEVVFEATYREQLDFYTIEKLTYKIENTDFKNFLDGVNSCVATKYDPVAKSSILTNPKHFDPVLSTEALKQRLKKKKEQLKEKLSAKEEVAKSPVVEQKATIKTSQFQSIKQHAPDFFTRKEVLAYRIGDHEETFTSWKDLLKSVCLYLKDENPMLFQQHCYLTESGDAVLFHKDLTDKWVAGRVKCRNKIEIEDGLYLINALNAKDIVTEIQKLMQLFEIPESMVQVLMIKE